MAAWEFTAKWVSVPVYLLLTLAFLAHVQGGLELVQVSTPSTTLSQEAQTALETRMKIPPGSLRRQGLTQLEILALLEKFPCPNGCSGHGICKAIPVGDEEPLEEATIHGSGCECDWPPYAGKGCEKKCAVTPINYTRNVPMTPLQATAYEVNVLEMPNVTYNITTVPRYLTPTIVTIDVACTGRGLCHPRSGLCECDYGYDGPACQYTCPRAPNTDDPEIAPYRNMICSGTARGNCTWNGTLASQAGSGWCHEQYSQCLDKNSINFGIKCECRWDLRGPDCSITCPKDYYGRVCSNNGTCDIDGICRCNDMVEGDYCQYGILNDTYKLWPTQDMLTPRRFGAVTGVTWYWEGWDDEIEVETHNNEYLAIFMGGAGQPKENEIMVFDPKTKMEFLERVIQQFSFQELYYWNHTLKDRDPYTQQLIERHWVQMTHQCFYTYEGLRVTGPCGQDELAYYVPNKRFGHSLITLGSQKALIIYGGYSTICADYCNDMWHFDIATRLWTFINMTWVPSPRYVSQEEYVSLYGLEAPIQHADYTAPIPAKRWLHTMCAVNETSVILFGGYYTASKQFYFMNDLWIYTLSIVPTPSNPGRFGENINLWHRVNDTDWGKLPGTARPPGRRHHIAAYIDHRLYVYGGQIFDGAAVYDMSGRETKSRSRINGDLWQWDNRDNQWRIIIPASVIGLPGPRYGMAFCTFRDSLIFHGGYSNPQYYDDMWVFNATLLSMSKITYKHRNALVYNPRPTVRFGHVIVSVGDSFLMFGGFGQSCVDEAMGTIDPDKTDDVDETSMNYFCMPVLERYPSLIDGVDGEPIWYNDVTGAVSTDPGLRGAGATRKTLRPIYYGDTWTFNHSRCPEDCNGHGVCNLNFCMCEHKMPPDCDSHYCVRPTFPHSQVTGQSGGSYWGFSCGFKGCANSSCYFNFTHQTEYCRHCQYNGHCAGNTGRCMCKITHQHILPLHYHDKEISRYGPSMTNMTTEPVPFYAEHVNFEMDPRRREDCQYGKCPHQFCSGHGYCMKTGTCHCDPTYIGGGCEYHAHCPQFCNYQGICVPKYRDSTQPWAWSGGGYCHCHDPFEGPRCATALRNSARKGIRSAQSMALVVVVLGLYIGMHY